MSVIKLKLFSISFDIHIKCAIAKAKATQKILIYEQKKFKSGKIFKFRYEVNELCLFYTCVVLVTSPRLFSFI